MHAPGQKIGRFILIQELGSGSYGSVWLASMRGEIIKRQIAVKILAGSRKTLDAIQNEAKIWSELSDPNVLPFISATLEGGYILLASPYMPNGSLRDWIKRNGGRAPSVEEAVRVMIGILKGLEHIHSKGVIHRDLKPDNVLLQNGQPKIADFGLSRDAEATDSMSQAGTPRYLAPEVWAGGRRDKESDIWAAGVILYKLLCGDYPFVGESRLEIQTAVWTDAPKPLPGSIDPRLGEIVKKALAKKVTDRYRSAKEMWTDLESVGTSAPATLTAPSSKRKRVASIALAVVGVLTLVGVGSVIWSKMGTPKRGGDQPVIESVGKGDGDSGNIKEKAEPPKKEDSGNKKDNPSGVSPKNPKDEPPKKNLKPMEVPDPEKYASLCEIALPADCKPSIPSGQAENVVVTLRFPDTEYSLVCGASTTWIILGKGTTTPRLFIVEDKGLVRRQSCDFAIDKEGLEVDGVKTQQFIRELDGDRTVMIAITRP